MGTGKFYPSSIHILTVRLVSAILNHTFTVRLMYLRQALCHCQQSGSAKLPTLSTKVSLAKSIVGIVLMFDHRHTYIHALQTYVVLI